MSESIVLMFRLPGADFDQIRARDAIAASLATRNVKDLLAPNDFPRCRIHGHRDMITMTVLQGAIDQALAVLPDILAGLKSRYGNVTLSTRNETISAVPESRVFTYKANAVVLAGSGKAHRRSMDVCQRLLDMSPDERSAYALEVLNRGIQRQAQALGINISGLDLPESVVLTNYAPLAPLITSGKKIVQHRPVASMLFNWNVRLNGSWHVGYLTARGHGRLWHDIGSQA